MQILFGDMSVLHTIRNRLAESEMYSKILTRFLVELLKACIIFKGKIVHCWRIIQQMANGFAKVAEEDI